MKRQRQPSELSAELNFSHLTICAYYFDEGNNLFQTLTKDLVNWRWKVADAVSLHSLCRKRIFTAFCQWLQNISFNFFCFACNSQLLELTAALCNHQHHSAKSVGRQVVRAFLLPVKEERPGGVVGSELFTWLQLIWSKLDRWLESGWLALKRDSMQDYPCPCIFVCCPCEALWGRDYGFPWRLTEELWETSWIPSTK